MVAMVRWYRARAALAAPAWGMAMGDGELVKELLGPGAIIHPDDQVQSQ